MSSTPPEDLVVYARQLDRDVMNTVREPRWPEPNERTDTADWRTHVPPTIRKLWGRIDFESRLVAFVVAAATARNATRPD